MRRRHFLGAAAGSSVAGAAPSVRERLLGSWRLVSFQHKNPDGRISYPYSEAPVGRLTYDHAGRMSAVLMRPGRRSAVAATLDMPQATTEDLRQILSGFSAYYGTFRVDEANRTVIHHVEASILPSWVGTDQKRPYELEGNRLILHSGDNRIEWERLLD